MMQSCVREDDWCTVEFGRASNAVYAVFIEDLTCGLGDDNELVR